MTGKSEATGGPCRIAASLRRQALPIVWASRCLGTWAASPTLRRRAGWERRRHFRRWTRHGRTSGHVGGNVGQWATTASPCRIAAKRLTLTNGESPRSQAVPIVWASGCLGTWAGPAPAGSRPSYAHVAHVTTPCQLAPTTRTWTRSATRSKLGDVGGNGGHHVPDHGRTGWHAPP
jgi:hypothetical protein